MISGSGRIYSAVTVDLADFNRLAMKVSALVMQNSCEIGIVIALATRDEADHALYTLES